MVEYLTVTAFEVMVLALPAHKREVWATQKVTKERERLQRTQSMPFLAMTFLEQLRALESPSKRMAPLRSACT